MSLYSEMESQGRWLFRWRSYLPFLFLPALADVLANMTWPYGSFLFHEVWEFGCLAVSFAGLFVRVLVIGYVPAKTSGRNTKGQIAESLNTSEIYSVVRHPLYLGNFLIALGAVMVPFQWWLIVVYCLAFWLYYERIMMAEEAFLREKFGSQYDQWASKTPAFLPRLSQWRVGEQHFSWRNVLKREYTALLVVVALHSGIEVAEHLIIEHQFLFAPIWEVILGGGALAYVILRILKRRTSWLNEVGR